MNSRELLIETFNNEFRVAVLESNILVDLIIERENRSSIVGDIFMGRVEKILPNISAAFIDIGKNKSGFLPLLEHDREQKQKLDSIVEGARICVQVKRDAFSDKGPQLSQVLSFVGRLLVFIPGNGQTSISRQIIDEDERKRLIELIEKIKETLLKTHFCQFNTRSDSEVLLNLFAYELHKTNFRTLKETHVFSALKNVFKKCEGGYAVVALIAGIGLVAFRDPSGIRPLVIGKQKSGYMVASESAALSALNYDLIRDVAPGEAVIISEDGKVFKRRCVKNVVHSPCLFEFVYFSRPDSVIDSISVHKARLRMGDFLGEKIKKEYSHLDVEVVIPVPDTSRTSAMQVAYHLGVKYREGFIKNRYIGRTFIMPGQSIRKKSVKHKLGPIEIEFRNKNVLLVDDSIVRGHTSKKIIEMARTAGAKKVYFASAAPPVRYQNIYGIDMPATSELIAHGKTEKAIKKAIGADELIYQDLDALKTAAHIGNPKITTFEDSVFSGEYRTGKISKDFLENLEKSRTEVLRKP